MSEAMAVDDEALLRDQAAFYRARAPEYDEWWQRRGRYDQGHDETAEWHRQVAAVDAALATFAATGDVLEMAGGTGWWTERLAPTADSLTVVDASPEVVAHNRQRVGREDVSYVEADLFQWRPDRTYDVVRNFSRPRAGRPRSMPPGGSCSAPRNRTERR